MTQPAAQSNAAAPAGAAAPAAAPAGAATGAAAPAAAPAGAAAPAAAPAGAAAPAAQAGAGQDPRDAKIAELTATTQDLAAKLEGAIGELKTHTQQTQRVADDKLRAVGKHDEIIAAREGTIADQAKTIAELEAGKAATGQAAQEQAVLDSVLKGVDSQKARRLLHGAYLVESAKGWEPAKPMGAGGDVQAAQRRDAIRELHPDLFGTSAKPPGALPQPRAGTTANNPFGGVAYGTKPRP